jgi:outer membrane autotransporter protein
MSISLKKILFAGTALVAMNYAASAYACPPAAQPAGTGTVTIPDDGCNVVEIDHDPQASPAINYDISGWVNIEDDVNITGDITVNEGSVGNLYLLGTTTVDGAVGSSDFSLFSLHLGATSETDVFSSTVNADHIVFGGEGTATFNGDVTGDATFQGNAGTMNLGVNANFTGDIYSGGEGVDGTLNLLGGTQTIAGNLGFDGEDLQPLLSLSVGADGGTATIEGPIAMVQFIDIAGTGTANLPAFTWVENFIFSDNGTANLPLGGEGIGNIYSDGGTVGDGIGNLAITGGEGDTFNWTGSIGSGGEGILNSFEIFGSGKTVDVSGDFISADNMILHGNTLNANTGGEGIFTLAEDQTLTTTVTGVDGSDLLGGNIVTDSTTTTTVATDANVKINFGLSSPDQIAVDDTFTIVAGNSGDIGAANVQDTALVSFSQVEDTDSLIVQIDEIKSIADVAGTANGDALGNLIDGMCYSETGCDNLQDAYNALLSAETAGEVDDILEALGPAGVDGGLGASMLDVDAQVMDLTETEIALLRSGEGATGMAAGATANGASMWGQGYGQMAKQDERNGIKGYDAETFGFAIGADSTNIVNKGVLGIAVNYGQSNINSKNLNTTGADITNRGVYLYGSYDLGQKAFINGQAGYGRNGVKTFRHNAGLNPGDTANADYRSILYSAKLLLGRDYAQKDGLTLTPNVSAAYANLKTDGYTETGTGTLLTVGEENFDSLKLGIGAKAEWNLKDNKGNTMKPSLHVDYDYDALGDNIEATANFVGGGPAFKAMGADPARSEVTLGAGFVYKTTANWDLSANYDYTYKADYAAHAGTLRMTSHF